MLDVTVCILPVVLESFFSVCIPSPPYSFPPSGKYQCLRIADTPGRFEFVGFLPLRRMFDSNFGICKLLSMSASIRHPTSLPAIY
ncbi:hypothetical protein BT69DRAFT_542545 [Atractiella rhizophila]|nr:hypothetical protein BT69DRAFT_542545 [Atractiella rhizophila]